MDGVTDCAYRIVCKEIFERHGNAADELMLWTEFMSADGYYHNPPGVIKHLMTSDYDAETIIQIFGGNADTLIHCAQDIESRYSVAGIELNMGCPSPKIMKCAAGSGMLKDKKKTLGILRDISMSISVPFSLKTRTGITNDDVEEQFDFLLEASKYVRCISVHGRTYGQSHSGEVNRDFLYRLKEALPDHVII
jgi:tRNA-dihydrouridine synthase